MANLGDMPKKAQLGIVLLFAVVVTAGLYMLFYKTISDENQANTLKLQAKVAENDKLRPYEQKLPELNRTIDALKMQLDNLQRIVPDEKAADEFMHVMQNEAQKSGIEIRRYESRPTASREFYTEVPFDLQLDGPYYSVVNFFDRVSKLERIINISDVQIGAIKGGDVKMKKNYQYAPRESIVATCVATTFFSHEPEQQAKPAKPAKAGK